ncbi:hypothetical protein PtB15_15B389 [Puccinia triticina]|nr:hypothetical protein PtB15_15B389 [Puccinia triticina]
MDSLQCLSASPLIEANAAIPSHLHPVALRSTTSASSPRIAAASKLVEAQLRASHASSPATSSVSGLSTPAEPSDVKPESTRNASSSAASGQSSKPGFLSSTSIKSSATTSTSSGYTGIDSVATTPTSPSTSVVSFDGPEPRASLLRSSLLPQDILERCPHSGQYMGFFASPRLPPTVNLRLFRQQPSRYATISDIVVYSEAGMSDDAIALAQLIRIAQDQCFRSRGGHAAGAIEYNNDQNRSFFVYPADVQLLRRVETRIEQEMNEQRKAQMHRMTIDEPSRNSFLRGCVSFSTSSAQNSKSTPTPPLTSCAAPSTPRSARSQHPWFYDSRFDGHFPSRILPFVYLGNLNHASNALMLKALGITHVVSMGEPANAGCSAGASSPEKSPISTTDICAERFAPLT